MCVIVSVFVHTLQYNMGPFLCASKNVTAGKSMRIEQAKHDSGLQVPIYSDKL